MDLLGSLKKAFDAVASWGSKTTHIAANNVVGAQRALHAEKYATTVGKNIVIFCDGTWQTEAQEVPTNISKIYRALADFNGAVPQISHHFDGVGTGQGLDHLFGGAFGAGLEEKIMEAYLFLADHYMPGDKIYFVGYSRGAYTARSLGGMINKEGLVSWRKMAKNLNTTEVALRKSNTWRKNLVQQLFDDYKDKGRSAENRQKPSSPEAVRKRILNSYVNENGDVTSTITAMACFDTVGSLGIPSNIMFSKQLNKQYEFHDTTLGWAIDAAFHAMAIDEKRSNFLGAPMEPGHEKTKLMETWFAGAHGIGGGKNMNGQGKIDNGLADIAGLWMIQNLTSAGLKFDPAKVDGKFTPNPLGQPEGNFFDPDDISSGAIADRVIPDTTVDTIDFANVSVRVSGCKYKPNPVYNAPNLAAQLQGYIHDHSHS